MTKPTPAAESTKSSKRKGTRSVSTLTPSQLARKRANDREAQRAIRARTKEHIDRLERELEELRSKHSRDETVQDLLKRNQALEAELRKLRASVGISGSSPTLYTSSYDGSSSRGSSFGQSSAEYPIMQDYNSYMQMPETTGESWSAVVPGSIPSAVSSPASTVAGDDFGTGYIPTSVPSSLMDRQNMPQRMASPAISVLGSNDMAFDDGKPKTGYPPVSIAPIPSAYYHQQPWNAYPAYYPPSPAL